MWRGKRSAVIGVIAAVALAPSLAHADEAPPPLPPPAETTTAPAPPPAPPPDVVRLKNGGILRGTILELTPDAPIVVQLPTGEIRRIPWADAMDAGPVKPRAPDPVAEPEQPAKVKKRLRSPGLLTAGIVVTAAAPIGMMVAMFAWYDGQRCKQDRDYDSWVAASRNQAQPISPDCGRGGLIAGSLLATAALLGAGIPMIVYGAKRVPLIQVNENETAVRFVPWNLGTAGAGGSLRVTF